MLRSTLLMTSTKKDRAAALTGATKQTQFDLTEKDTMDSTQPETETSVPGEASVSPKNDDTDLREKDWTATDILPSELGTKSYWKLNYQRELNNFLSHGDEGEVWFGAQNEVKLVRYLAKKFPRTVSIIDIGCGNGHLLVRLAKEEFVNLTGIDYVEDALELAKKVAAESDIETNIKFMKGDILAPDCADSYDLIIDKGTYDAISLMPGACLKKNRKDYIESIKQLMKKDSVHSARFLLTSCNWTKDELMQQFGADFDVVDELPTPKLTFGGKEGRTVTSLVFRYRQDSPT